MHLVEVEGQKPFVRNGFKCVIVDFEVDRLGLDEDLFRRCWEVNFRPYFRLTILSVGNEGSLDEVVVKGAGEPAFIAFGWKTVERIGEVGGNFGITVRRKQGLKAIGSGFSWVVGDTGFEPDRDDGIRSVIEQLGGQQDGVGCALLNNRVGEQIVHALSDAFVGRFPVDEVAANRTNLSHVNPVVSLELTTNDIPANITHSLSLARGNFHTCNWHVLHRARWASGGCCMRSL